MHYSRNHHATDAATTPMTAEWLAEQQLKQAAYVARRARWTNAVRRGVEPEPPTETEHRPERRSRTISDRRQLRLDV